MFFALPFDFLLFGSVAVGLMWPLAERLPLAPPEKFGASLALSLFAAYLGGFAIYALTLPTICVWALPALGAAALLVRWRGFFALLRDPETRTIASAQLLVSAWCLGWLALIVSYSGAAWMGDWIEHWDRARFYLERWPRHHLFIGFYELPARPPLVNVLTGALLRVTRVDFAHYQMFTSLLGSLTFTPAALLARRFGAGKPVTALLAVLIMLNPLFVQNATFAWTKLPAAFFVLSGLGFFLRGREPNARRSSMLLAVLCLAAALLAHYSAGPYVVALALAWLGLNRARWRDGAFWRQTAVLGLVGGAALATWFGWSIANYGSKTTFFSNTSVSSPGAQGDGQLRKIAANLRDTLVPPALRPMDEVGRDWLRQSDPWGYYRDLCFLHYNLNLWLALGSAGGLAVAWLLVRTWRQTPAGPARRFWLFFVTIVIVLGVGTHAGRSAWGLAHICLQPLVVLGLAFLAANWRRFGRTARRLIAVGAALDLALGIVLHFGVQGLLIEHWLHPERSTAGSIAQLSFGAQMNFADKEELRVAFFGDALILPAGFILALLALLLALGLTRAWIERISHRSAGQSRQAVSRQTE